MLADARKRRRSLAFWPVRMLCQIQDHLMTKSRCVPKIAERTQRYKALGEGSCGLIARLP